MKKVALYVRVSTPDQHVESQLYDLRELAAQRGYEVVHEYEDRGISGTKARCPGFGCAHGGCSEKKVLDCAFSSLNSRSACAFEEGCCSLAENCW